MRCIWITSAFVWVNTRRTHSLCLRLPFVGTFVFLTAGKSEANSPKSLNNKAKREGGVSSQPGVLAKCIDYRNTAVWMHYAWLGYTGTTLKSTLSREPNGRNGVCLHNASETQREHKVNNKDQVNVSKISLWKLELIRCNKIM